MYTLIISQDNETKKVFTGQESDSKAFGWLLNNQGNSITHAVKYEGWDVEQIDESNGNRVRYSSDKDISLEMVFDEIRGATDEKRKQFLISTLTEDQKLLL